VTVSRRLSVLLSAVLVSVALSACGKHEATGLVRTAETEGIYLDVSDLKYQIQVSRQLNPHDTQDRPYLAGLSATDAKLAPDQVWFGVFMRVQNETKGALRPSDDIRITDSQEEVFKPIALGAQNNYAYRSNDAIPGEETMPLLDTPGYDTPSRGALILFKVTLTALSNRPLELRLEGRKVPQQTGIFTLDV
jgi:hypothetical protein